LAFALHLVSTLSLSALIYAVVLRPLRWLHPFFGIAPLKRAPSRAAGAAETTPPRRPWPVMAGRFATLYVASPLLVLAMAGSLIASAVFLSRMNDGSNRLDESDQQELVERFREETAARSLDENYREAQELMVSLKESMDEGNAGRADVLVLEIRTIMEAMENESTAEATPSRSPDQETNEADPGLRHFIERIHTEIASRSFEENRAVAEGLLAPLREAMEARDAGLAKDLAIEIQTIMEALADPERQREVVKVNEEQRGNSAALQGW
jgi:hypothetical protein